MKKLTIETLWPEPRHERGKWKELLETNLVDFEPFPLEKNMVDELLCGKTLHAKVIIICFSYRVTSGLLSHSAELYKLNQAIVFTLFSKHMWISLGFQASAVRIIRVFISFTFTDTAQERNLLIADGTFLSHVFSFRLFRVKCILFSCRINFAQSWIA